MIFLKNSITTAVMLLSTMAIVASGSTAAARTVLRGVVYATSDGVRLRLDGDIPQHERTQPLAILVHGGSWSHGSRNTYIGPLEKLLSTSGIAWIAIDYRLAPRYRFPADLQDVEQAILWVKMHARSYHVDPEHLVLIGESSGGQLVGLIGTQDKPAIHVAGIVDMYGPNDLSILPDVLPTPPQAIRDLLGITDWSNAARAKLRAASPQSFVKPGLPPFLFLHGTADALVPPIFSDRLCAALKIAGDRCDVVHIPGAIHGMENWEGHPEQVFWKSVLIDWIHRTVGAADP